MTIQHKGLAQGRWQQLSFFEQMANIGSEVGRAIQWKKKGNAGYYRKAASRSLELVDLTLANSTGFAKFKELARLREALVDYFFGQNIFRSSEKLWQKYFYHFNYVARKAL